MSLGRLVDVDDLVGMGQIAEILGVSINTPSNWWQNRKKNNFPEAVYENANGKFKVFAWSEVEAWWKSYQETYRDYSTRGPKAGMKAPVVVTSRGWHNAGA